MPRTPSPHDSRLPRPRPLPVTITPGMPVVGIDDNPPATIAGITQEYCLYRHAHSGMLAVARWGEVALGHLCPAPPLLPADVTQRDRGNAQAAVLRELLNLRQSELTPQQQKVLEALVAELCGDSIGA